MEDPRWVLLQQRFREALALPPGGREDLIAALAAQDAGLADELRRLLAQDRGDDVPVHEAIARAAARLVGDQRDARIGQQLGPWRIVAHLADGGMGAVYRGERADGRYEQPVAIKLLNPAYASEEAKARLDAERRILARLEHPAIARLLDGGSGADGVPYLVMEFVDGDRIDAWCDDHGLGTAARLRLFVQVCRAVEHAHRNLVVHRDLKPANILVDREGRPRLLDFGIAKLVDGAPGITRTGERLLTPSHASPEQITGGPVTTATDVYALGVLLYDLLAGRPPYGGPGTPPAVLARQIVETPPPRPSHAVTDADSSRRLAAARARGERLTPQRLAQELAGDLDNIVLMALRKEPERRYASAAALAEDIERSLAHLPVRARPDTLGYRGAKFLRRHPVAVPVSVLALLLAGGGAAGFTWRLAQERDRALAAEAAARRTADFTASLLQGTAAEAGGAARVSVRELLDKAVQRVEHELPAEPEVAARMRHALGRAYQSWEAYEQAQAQQQAALLQLRRLHAGPHPDIATVLSSLGNNAHALGDLEASLRWAREAEREWRAVGSPFRQAAALGDVGVALNSLRRLDEAEATLRQALAALQAARPGDDAEIAYYRQYQGYNRYRAGALDEALPHYEAALAMLRRLGTRLPQVADLLQQLSAVQDDRGDLEGAERSAREVLPLLQQLYGGDGGSAAMAVHNRLATVLGHRGRWDEALQQASAALGIGRRLYGPDHRYTASGLQLQASVLLRLGRLDDAEAALAEATRVRHAVLAPDSPDHVSSRVALARLAQARGRAAEAERHLREALAAPAPRQTIRIEAEVMLGTLLAGSGRRDEGRALVVAAVARLADGHWRREALQAQLTLPPFADRPDAAAVAAAAGRLAALRARLGPSAPVVQALESALQAAGR